MPALKYTFYSMIPKSKRCLCSETFASVPKKTHMLLMLLHSVGLLKVMYSFHICLAENFQESLAFENISCVFHALRASFWNEVVRTRGDCNCFFTFRTFDGLDAEKQQDQICKYISLSPQFETTHKWSKQINTPYTGTPISHHFLRTSQKPRFPFPTQRNTFIIYFQRANADILFFRFFLKEKL